MAALSVVCVPLPLHFPSRRAWLPHTRPPPHRLVPEAPLDLPLSWCAFHILVHDLFPAPSHATHFLLYSQPRHFGLFVLQSWFLSLSLYYFLPRIFIGGLCPNTTPLFPLAIRSIFPSCVHAFPPSPRHDHLSRLFIRTAIVLSTTTSTGLLPKEPASTSLEEALQSLSWTRACKCAWS